MLFSLDDKNSAKSNGTKKTKWINVVDENAWKSKYVEEYGIKGIPYNVLIDFEGKIVGENFRGEGLKQLLEKVLH